MIRMNNTNQLDHLVTHDPDVQEAHSRRYGAGAFMALPLASGAIAVLGHYRDLHAICDSWEEACEAALTIPMLEWRRRSEAEDPDKPKATLVTTKTASDLGF